MGRLDGKVALITGGESGIGLATARLFVAEGARVGIVGLDAARLHEAAASLGPEVAEACGADVTDEAAVRDAVAMIVERFGPLDVVLSNAGISGPVAPLAEVSSESFARTLDVHVRGAFHVLKHAIPVLRDGGSVIINSSVMGLVGAPGVAAYAAAKHAQVGLMRSAAKELAPRRIRVNTLHPGPTSTPFQTDIEKRVTGAAADDAAAAFDTMIPIGRHARVEEIAEAALYLAGDASAMVTASTFAIDGGMSAG